MNILNLFKLDYWFSQPFTARGMSFWLFVGGFLFLILAGLICKILSQYQNYKPMQTVLKRLGSLGLIMGFLGLVWMFFRQEMVAFLAWRFWLLFGAAAAGFAFWKAVGRFLKRNPKLKAEEAKREQIEKYLPKSNK